MTCTCKYLRWLRVFTNQRCVKHGVPENEREELDRT